MEEIIQNEIEEVILEEESPKLERGLNVTEFKIEKDPPVIKPTKELTEKEIEEIFKTKEKVNVTEFKIEKDPPVIKPTKELTEKEIEEILKKKKFK